MKETKKAKAFQLFTRGFIPKSQEIKDLKLDKQLHMVGGDLICSMTFAAMFVQTPAHH